MSTMDEQDDIELEATGEENGQDIHLEDAEASASDKQKSLRAKLKICETEKMQALEDAQRTKAEFLNSKKRLEEQAARDVVRAQYKFVMDLLPLADSFDMAMQNTATWEATDEVWRKGVEGIYQQLQSLLTKHNAVAVDPTGEAFNPEHHEALSTTDSEDESDTIVSVIQKGYERNGEIIRPAKVVISN